MYVTTTVRTTTYRLVDFYLVPLNAKHERQKNSLALCVEPKTSNSIRVRVEFEPHAIGTFSFLSHQVSEPFSSNLHHFSLRSRNDFNKVAPCASDERKSKLLVLLFQRYVLL